MVHEAIEIDRNKLRTVLRKLRHKHVFYMLYDAIDLVPEATLHRIVGKCLDPAQLCPDRGKAMRSDLLADVKAFEKDSLAGEYYESFVVDSKNCTALSRGTMGWIAECHRLLDRCVEHVRTPGLADPAEVCRAFDIILGLLDEIDECRDDIIFFADEAGAWQVGVDWDRVLPAWFRVLSAIVSPEEYAERITTVLRNHHNFGRDNMLSAAHKVGTPEQRKVLAEVAAE